MTLLTKPDRAIPPLQTSGSQAAPGDSGIGTLSRTGERGGRRLASACNCSTTQPIRAAPQAATPLPSQPMPRGRSEGSDNPKLCLRMLCDAGFTGGLIGKVRNDFAGWQVASGAGGQPADVPSNRQGGENIQKITRESGARVLVEDHVPGSRERVVTIIGERCDDERSSAAADALCGVFDTLCSLASSLSGGRGQPTPASGTAAAGEAGAGNGAGHGIAAEHEARLLVEGGSVGWLVGRSGVSIKETAAKSGARVQVMPRGELPPCASPSEELLSVVGPGAAVSAALRLVARQLKQQPRSRGSGSSGGGVPSGGGNTPQPLSPRGSSSGGLSGGLPAGPAGPPPIVIPPPPEMAAYMQPAAHMSGMYMPPPHMAAPMGAMHGIPPGAVPQHMVPVYCGAPIEVQGGLHAAGWSPCQAALPAAGRGAPCQSSPLSVRLPALPPPHPAPRLPPIAGHFPAAGPRGARRRADRARRRVRATNTRRDGERPRPSAPRLRCCARRGRKLPQGLQLPSASQRARCGPAPAAARQGASLRMHEPHQGSPQERLVAVASTEDATSPYCAAQVCVCVCVCVSARARA